MVFLPWVSFWSQVGSSIPDYAKVKVGVANESTKCKKIEKTFRTTVVRTTESRAKGLGGRSTPLAQDEAMLFVFDKPMQVSFWMKDTLIPLEIAFFNPDGKLTETLEMPVESDPSNPVGRYNSTGLVVTALETPPQSLAKLKNQKNILCIDLKP